MGYGTLIWIVLELELWLCGLLLTAAVVALLARTGSRWEVTFFGLIVAAVPTAVWAMVVRLAQQYEQQTAVMLSGILAVVTGVGSVAIVLAGSWRRRGEHPAAQGWRPGRLLIGSLITALAFVGTVFVIDWRMRTVLQAAGEEAQAMAHSVLPPPVPDELNAVTLYAKAAAELPEDTDALYEQLALWDGWPPDLYFSGAQPFDPHDPALREFLQRYERGIGLLREAAQRRECRFTTPSDYDRPNLLTYTIPDVAWDVRRAFRLLELDAARSLADEDFETAVDDVATMYRISSHFAQEPTLFSLTLAANFNVRACRVLEALCNVDPRIDGHLHRLEFERDFSFRERFARAATMEAAMGLGWFAVFVGDDSPALEEEGYPDNAALRWLVSVYMRVIVLPNDLATFRRDWDLQQRFIQQPVYERQEAIEGPVLQLMEGGEYKYSAFALASLALFDGQVERYEAYDRLARLLQAAAGYRAAHGKLPESLQALVAEAPELNIVDPLDGQPLRLLKQDDGILLYSIGSNRIDDGGEWVLDEPAKGDIVVGLGTRPFIRKIP